MQEASAAAKISRSLVAADEIRENGFDLSYKNIMRWNTCKWNTKLLILSSTVSERYAQLNTAFDELKKMLED